MIRGQKVDCLSHGFCLMSNFDSSVKAIGKVSTHLTEEPENRCVKLPFMQS